eukprot:COSAG04_NODE_1569_length_6310_cov_6.835614_7_plen_242_part_00
MLFWQRVARRGSGRMQCGGATPAERLAPLHRRPAGPLRVWRHAVAVAAGGRGARGGGAGAGPGAWSPAPWALRRGFGVGRGQDSALAAVLPVRQPRTVLLTASFLPSSWPPSLVWLTIAGAGGGTEPRRDRRLRSPWRERRCRVAAPRLSSRSGPMACGGGHADATQLHQKWTAPFSLAPEPKHVIAFPSHLCGRGGFSRCSRRSSGSGATRTVSALGAAPLQERDRRNIVALRRDRVAAA